jgi:hypothetical protein
MGETRIHSGTRVKLKSIAEGSLPTSFVSRLREFAHADPRIEALFLFAIQPEEREEQICLAVALKKTLFAPRSEEFLQIVDEIQMLLPEDLGINLYRFGTSDLLASYCAHSVEPTYLRNAAWLRKQQSKYRHKHDREPE